MSDEKNGKPSAMRLWLARHKPDRVRCTLADGTQRELPKPSIARGQWAHLEHAIELLNPAYIEALRGNDCIASRTLESVEDEQAQALAPAADPVTAMVNAMPTMTQLIVDAGDASAMRHQEAYKMAFEAMLEQNKQYLQLVQVISSRLGGLEKAWHQMLLDRQNAQGVDGENDAAAMQVLNNLLRNGGPPAAKPPEDPQ